MTLQERMKTKLQGVGLPYKNIDVYGQQIVVTSGCERTAGDWASLLKHFAKVKGVRQTVDDAKVNMNTVLKPSKVVVWRTYATM